jgi:type I restriction enzyme S subunit
MKWETKKLETVADFCLGKMLDQKKNRGEPLPYLANVNVRWGEFDLADLREMRFEHHELERYGLQYGDIVMCEGGEPGRCAIWKDQCSSMMIQKALHRIRPHKCLTPEFLYYFFLYKGRIGHLSPLFTGATIKHLPREKLALVEVPVPPHSIQEHIASVLSAYDDLIENNRRRIQLLEQAARLLYKEWFVHLRFPGHEHSKIINGMPEGWEKKTAFEVMDVLSGGTPKTTNPAYWDGDIPFFTPKDVTGFAYAHDTEKSITEAGLKNCNSHLYPKDTVFITARGTVGKINLAQRPMAMNQSCYALIAHPPLNQQFLYFALVDGVEQFRSRAVGSVFDAVVRDTFKLIPFVVPEEKLITAFMEHISPMLAQIDNLSGQTRSLQKARDLLLPKLMNGEVAA